MANICDVRMRIAAKDAESIRKFIEDVRDNGTFLVYDGIFTGKEEFDPGLVLDIDGAKAYDVWFSCKWSFISSFEEDGVNKTFGKDEPSFAKYFHEFCKDHGVGVEVYSEESGVGFEEHYLIAPSGEILESECVKMTEHYNEEDDSWTKEGGFGNPDFLYPEEILGDEGDRPFTVTITESAPPFAVERVLRLRAKSEEDAKRKAADWLVSTHAFFAEEGHATQKELGQDVEIIDVVS